jgi:hypothetical protein
MASDSEQFTSHRFGDFRRVVKNHSRSQDKVERLIWKWKAIA